jgi:hypothetical protein
MPSLAEAIGNVGSGLALRQAVVTAVPTSGTCQIRMGGSTTDIAGVPMLTSASVSNGDTVWVLQDGNSLLIVGTLYPAVSQMKVNSLKITPNQIRDDLIDLWGGAYVIGVRPSEFYMRSNGTIFSWETPGGSWAMRFGPGEVNAGERGLKVSANLEGNEVYSNGWFRSRSGGTGLYSQTYGGGVFMEDSSYVKIYGGKEFWAPSNKIRAQMARFGESGPWADHVCYSHNNYQQDGNDGFMQRWDGWAWMRSNGQLGFTSRGGDIAWMDNSGGWCDFRPNLPSLGGDPMVIAGSQQIGRSSSSIRWKDRIGNLLGTAESPVWKFQPVRFLWKEDDGIHQSRNEVNARNPKGMAGFIAEEVAEVAPDAVNYDSENLPSSIESWAMLAYIIAGLQHLKSRIEALERA